MRIEGTCFRNGWMGFFGVTLVLGMLPRMVIRGDENLIRGDVNGDGKVSVSDAYLVSKYLVHQAELSCPNAADADDNGRIDGDDQAIIMHSAWNFGPNVQPFGIPGPDPTPNTDTAISCASYGGGTPIVDSIAELVVRDVVAPGGTVPFAVVKLGLTSSKAIYGYQAHLRDPSGVVGNYRLGDSYDGEERYGFNYGPARDLTGTFERLLTWCEARVFSGDLWVGYAGIRSNWVKILPQNDKDVIEFTVCFRPGTKAGTYPLTLDFGEFADASGRPIVPRLVSGTLTVLQDLDSGLGCPDRQDPSPDNIISMWELGDTSGTPGALVRVPLRVEADWPIGGYMVSIDFNEEILEATQVLFPFTRPDGKDYDLKLMDMHNDNLVPGSGGIDEGFIVGAVVFDFGSLDQTIPANRRTEILELEFRVKPNAPVDTTEVRFLDGAVGRGEPLPNILMTGGFFVSPNARDGFVFVNSRVNILPGGTPFIRGDSNQDSKVDISDASYTLSSLFLGTVELHCPDAADANDDGRVDVSDAITTLMHLFLGTSALPPPVLEPGDDPTPDGLICQ